MLNVFKTIKTTYVKITTGLLNNTAIIGGLSGVLLLSGLSYGQKRVAGYDPYLCKGYIVSTVCGFIFGFLLGTYIHKLKRALKKNEEKYRAVADFTFDWEYWADVNGNFVYVSPSCKKISGYQAQEFIQDPSLFFSLVHPDDLDNVKRHLEHPTESTNTCNLNFRITDRNGREHWIQHNCLPVYDSNANWLGRRGNNHDFTALKRAEDASLNYAKRFKIFFEATNDAIFVHPFKKEGFFPFIEVNPIACRRYGYSRDEFLKLTAADVTGEAFAKQYGSIYNRNKLLESRHQVFEALHIKKTGEKFPVEINANIVEQSGQLFIIAVVRDISDRKQAEKEKEKLQSQLQQSQKMEAIGTLAGGIAHDFNNILFPIMGHSEMLLEDLPKDDPARSSVREILSGAMRAKDLIQQILTFSRQEKVELRLIKIQPVLKEAMKMLRSTIPTTIEIQEKIDPGCGPVKADPIQIHQVIINLTTNAYHAMENSGGTLGVELKETNTSEQNPHLAPGRYACLTVRDTGTGIPKEITESIFDPFFTTKKNGKGTGLGLSVVHGIVTNMKGDIRINSKPGEGSEFKIYFPVEKHAFHEEDRIIEDDIPSGTEHILLLDDEPGIIAIEKTILERLGYTVTSRTSSIEALEVFQSQPDKFDLVITDYSMPKMAGDQIAQELLKIRPDIRIILCTGFSDRISEETAEQKGIRTVLKKPLTKKELAKKIREVLEIF